MDAPLRIRVRAAPLANSYGDSTICGTCEIPPCLTSLVVPTVFFGRVCHHGVKTQPVAHLKQSVVLNAGASADSLGNCLHVERCGRGLVSLIQTSSLCCQYMVFIRPSKRMRTSHVVSTKHSDG